MTGYAQAVSVTPPVRADLIKGGLRMAFGGSAVGVLQTLVVALGAGVIEAVLEMASDSLGGFMRS